MNKKKTFALLLVAALMLTGCGKIATLKNGEEIVAKMDGKSITAEDLYGKLKKQGGAVTLTNMIDSFIVNKEIKTDEDAKSYADSQLSSYKKSYQSYGQDFNAALTSAGYADEEEFKEELILEYKKNIVTENYVKDELTDDEIQKYYDLSNGTAGYRQIKEQLEYHEGIIISYYMAFLMKCCIMKLPESRVKSKNKGKYAVTTKDEIKKYTYQNIAENIDINDIYKVISTDTTEVKSEKDGKQNVSFFIDAYSTEILVSCIGKSLNNDFIEYNLDLLSDSDYKLDNTILHSDRGGMYKSGIYNTKTAEMHLIPSMSAPYTTCTHNP